MLIGVPLMLAFLAASAYFACDIIAHAGTSSWEPYYVSAAMGLMALIFAYMAWSGFRDYTNPRRHSVFQKMAGWGLLEQVVSEVEDEIRGVSVQIGRFVFTPGYLVDTQRPEVFLYSELIWIYKKQTSRSVNFVSAGTTYEVVLHLRSRWQTSMAGPASTVDHALHMLADRCPWIVVGYSPELEAQWTKSASDFIAEVDARRHAHEES